MKIMTQLDKYRVIIIDDIGYVRKTDAETQVLFEFIAHRYESDLPGSTAGIKKVDHANPKLAMNRFMMSSKTAWRSTFNLGSYTVRFTPSLYPKVLSLYHAL